MAPRSEPQPALGDVLRDLRLRANMTQQELGHATGLHPTWISRLEGGEKNPGWATVKRLAKALGVSVADIAQLEAAANQSQTE